MNNTIGMPMDGVDVTKLGDPKLKHWPGEIWVSFSEIYARLAAVNANTLRFMNFIGPGADQSESVWEQMESRTLSQIATTLYSPEGANASSLPEVMVREWYVIPTHIKNDKGKEIVMWNEKGQLLEFTNQADAFKALPNDYTKQQLQNSFILLV